MTRANYIFEHDQVPLVRESLEDVVFGTVRWFREHTHLDAERTKSSESISGIREAAIRQVIDDNVKTPQGVIAALTSAVGLVASLRALGDKKKRKSGKGGR
jgi:hypothetical protein